MDDIGKESEFALSLYIFVGIECKLCFLFFSDLIIVITSSAVLGERNTEERNGGGRNL